MDNKSKPIKFEDMGFSPKDKLKIPSRRELSSRPWSDDQMHIFIVRQKCVPNILAEMGIKIKGTTTYEQAKVEREKEFKNEDIEL